MLLYLVPLQIDEIEHYFVNRNVLCNVCSYQHINLSINSDLAYFPLVVVCSSVLGKVTQLRYQNNNENPIPATEGCSLC